MTRSRWLDASGLVQVYNASGVVGESTLAPYHAAEAWLISSVPRKSGPVDGAALARTVG